VASLTNRSAPISALAISPATIHTPSCVTECHQRSLDAVSLGTVWVQAGKKSEPLASSTALGEAPVKVGKGYKESGTGSVTKGGTADIVVNDSTTSGIAVVIPITLAS
jgi:hypothetical protein